METMTATSKLTNLQLELIKYFRYEVSEEELLEIKRMLAAFFAKRAMDRVDEIWDERGWSNETMDAWLKEDNNESGN